MQSSNSFLMLDLACHQVTAEAYLNGIPVARVEDRPGASSRLFRPVHQFLLDGRNQLTLAVALGGQPSTSLAPSGPLEATPSANVRLTHSLLPEGAFYDDPRASRIAELLWRTPETSVAAPVVLQNQFDLPPASRNWSWLSGAPLNGIDTEVLKDSIFAALRVLRQSIHERNPEPYIELAQSRYRDVATAYQLPPGEPAAMLREQIGRVSAEPGWAMEDVQRNQIDPRLCAGGRVVECLDSNWLPTLRTKPLPSGAIRLRFPTFLANIGGAWRIVA